MTWDELILGIMGALERSGVVFDWDEAAYCREQRERDKESARRYYDRYVSYDAQYNTTDTENDEEEGDGEWLNDMNYAEAAGAPSGVGRIIAAADGDAVEALRRLERARGRVRRRAPECLATFNGIVRNGSNREATITELMIGKRRGGCTTGSCRSCASCSA